MIVTVVLFAGGKGSRMGPAGQHKQKCLTPIEGKPAIGHILDALSQAFGRVHLIVCVSHRADDVQKYIHTHTPDHFLVEYVFHEAPADSLRILQTAQARVPKGPFLFTSGDVIAKPEAYRKVYERIQQRDVFAAGAFATDVDEIDTHATIQFVGDRISKIYHTPPRVSGPDYLRDMDIWGFRESIFVYADTHPAIAHITALLDHGIDSGEEITPIVYEDKWVHIAYQDDALKTLP